MIALSPQWMLLGGIGLSLVAGPALRSRAKTGSTYLLQASIVLLGAALNFSSVLRDGVRGGAVTLVSILAVFLAGLVGVRLLRLDRTLGYLITMGTAICGGSAIGALAPVLGAEATVIAISLAIVFLLNALAVLVFPPIGAYLALSQDAFGTWAALAIHDTSSVVAAASVYGPRALAVATTVKLTRALWIIPVTLLFASLVRRPERKLVFPWFVLGFLLTSLAFTFAPVLAPLKAPIVAASRLGFAVTLFLLGLTFDLKKLRQVGARPLVFGVGLWLAVVVGALLYLRAGQPPNLEDRRDAVREVAHESVAEAP